MTEPPSAICLVIDRLSAANLGALGNTWIRTPAFDRLAAESLVHDRATIDSPDLNDLYYGLWAGRPAWSNVHRPETDVQPTLIEQCRELGAGTVLLTDDDSLAVHPLAAQFDEVVRVSPPHSSQQPADWQDTQLAAFFAAAIELLDSMRPPALLWLHTGALARVWDSPQQLRAQYAAEDDPPPPSITEPPSLVIGDDADPDLLLGFRHAYAGEVSVLDHCLEMLHRAIATSPWRDALFSVSSARGFPLGEHGVVGHAVDQLYGELIRMPWFVRFPAGPAYGARSHALVQPLDVHIALAKWIGGSVACEPTTTAGPESTCSPTLNDPIASHHLAITRAASGEVALTTPAWFVRAPIRSDVDTSRSVARGVPPVLIERRFELFAKPDDYFEANEVSNRCHEIVELFGEVVRSIDAAWQDSTHPALSLAEALLHDAEAGRPCN